MKSLQVTPRKKDERSVYGIYPLEAIFSLGPELGHVKARTPSEALKLAAVRGIGAGQQLAAIEHLSESRIVAIED